MTDHVTANLNTPRWSRRLLAIAVACALLMTVWALSPGLWDRYRVVRDVQNFYWMARAQDADLFPTDYLYISDSVMIQANVQGFHLLLYPLSLGYGLIFYLASVYVEYIWLAKLSVLILVPICVGYLYKSGQWLKDNLTGVSLSLIFTFFVLASPLSVSIASGLQRAFALPLMIVFLYYLLRRKFISASLMIVLSALIYLPNFPLMVLTYALMFVVLDRRHGPRLNLVGAKLTSFGLALLLSGVFVVLALFVQLDLLSAPVSVPAVSEPLENVTDDATYHARGAQPLFIGFPFLGRAGIFDTGGDVVNFIVLMILGLLVYKVNGPSTLRRVPGALWRLLAASLIMYFISLIFVFGFSSFALYLPSRYTRISLLLVMLFFVGLNWVDFLNELPAWATRNARLIIFFLVSLGMAFVAIYLIGPNQLLIIPTLWIVGLMLSGVLALWGGSNLIWLFTRKSPRKHWLRWGIALLVTLIVISLGTIYIGILGVKTTNPSRAERDIYEFVATLPKETVLAGDPDVMTNIPLFSRRSVLFRELFPGRNAPIVEYFDAQYAESAQPILDFCRRYQIGYLVLDSREFSADYLAEKKFFYQPWNDRIVDLVSDRSDFVLTQIQPVYNSGPFAVIKCDGTMTHQLSAAD
jgi:hypothetical protein